MLCLWPEVPPKPLVVQAVLQDMLCFWPEVPPPQPLMVQAVRQDNYVVPLARSPS